MWEHCPIPKVRESFAGALAAAVVIAALPSRAMPIDGLFQRPLTEVFPMLNRYLSTPETARSMFRLHYCAQMLAPSQASLRLRFKTSEKDLTLSTDSSGCFLHLPDLSDLRANPIAVASAPEGAFRIIVALEPAIPLGRAMRLSHLEASIAQANAAARAAAGPLAWGAPAMDSVHFDFGTGSNELPPVDEISSQPLGLSEGIANQDITANTQALGEAVFSDGRRAKLPWRDGRIVLKPSDPDIRGADWIVFSADPQAARIGFSSPLKK